MSSVWTDKDYVDRYNNLYNLPPKEISRYMQLLELNSEDVLVDFGCGQGDFLLAAANKVNRAIGVDLATHQLNRLLANSPQDNVEVMQTSFAACELKQDNITKGFARISLHHITDSEKNDFFHRIGGNFAQGSLFLIYDVVFDFDLSELSDRRKVLIEEAKEYYKDQWEVKKDDILNTWFNEYPTDYRSWKYALEQGGFSVVKYERVTSFIGLILAQK